MYSSVGVFVGVEPSGRVVTDAGNAFSATGSAASITSGRFSYALGLVGPCYTIDTACSSALAALHVCTAALLRAECGRCVSVGTKVLSEAANYGTSVAGMTSLLGRCHTFDGRADGYCRGEGCGAFCVRGDGSSGTAGRASFALVLGSAVQQDGPSASLTAPNGSSQRRLLDVLQGDVKVRGEPSLEAHGTGTALGDPIEVFVLFVRGLFCCGMGGESTRNTDGCWFHFIGARRLAGGRCGSGTLRDGQCYRCVAFGFPRSTRCAVYIPQGEHGAFGGVCGGGGAGVANFDTSAYGSRADQRAVASVYLLALVYLLRVERIADRDVEEHARDLHVG